MEYMFTAQGPSVLHVIKVAVMQVQLVDNNSMTGITIKAVRSTLLMRTKMTGITIKAVRSTLLMRTKSHTDQLHNIARDSCS